MSEATHARPLNIKLACLAFLVAGLWSLIKGLSDLDLARYLLLDAFPQIDWDRDWTIVALFTEFTIALLPIIWIWFLARPFARWAVTAIGLWKLFALVSAGSFALTMPLIVLSLVLLFTPSASRYFSKPRAADAV